MLFEGINNSMIFSVTSLIYMIFFSFYFISKKKIKSIELNIFKLLIITNLVSLCLECFIVVFIMNDLPFIEFILKLFNIFIFTYVYLIALYSYVTLKKKNSINKKNKLYTIYLIFYIFTVFMITALPVSLNETRYMQYSYGGSVNYLFFSISFLIILMFSILCFNLKKISKKKFFPIFLLIILLTINAIVQYIWPNILLVNLIFSLVTFIMYHTIENPDVKMLEEVELAREQADKANQAKTEFLSSMSHEIRTPLNAIVGFSQNLYEEDIPSTAKEQVQDIITASNNLLELVNGILDISKIEANKLEIVNEEYSFKKIFNELISLGHARMGDKSLIFKTNYDESIPKVLYGDKLRVKQVILNILTNSIKYTKKGFIEFKVNSIIKDDVCRLIISVEDSGVGIKKENIDKLFTKFQRFEDRNTTIEGTGLGLAITKKLVDLMNGQIIVQSVYGQGSKFTIAIDQRIIKDSTISVEEDVPIVLTDETYDLTGKKVLVVDDNKLNLKVASKLLEKYHLTLELVSSGFDCVNKIIAGEKYDLILLDDMMPKMSGVETLKELKKDESFKTKVVALTANAISGMKEKYLNDGFDDYLAKPIDKLELKRVLQEYLK